MAKFQMVPLTANSEMITARVADGAGTANQLNRLDNGKLVRLKGDSQYGLSAVGEEIEGLLVAADTMAPQDGFNLGTVQTEDRIYVTLDGLQGTPGTGVVAVGDYVVTGTAVARGTSLSGSLPKVCKATTASSVVFKWRVIAITVGTGAVGSTAVIEMAF